MFRGRGEGLAFLQRTVPFLPTMIDAIKQRLERRNIVRSKQPLVIVDTCEDEMRYGDRLDLVLLIKDCLAFRVRRFRQDIHLELLDEFSRLCRGLIEMKAADQLWFVTLDRGQREETTRRPE